MPDRYPLRYRPLADRYGPPASIEDARITWGHVVKGAENGTVVTLIARSAPGGPDWVAVVPLSEVPDPGTCPVWPLSEARAKLGEVVDAATSFPPVPQILARHRQPVAAVIDARMISDLPGDGEAERIDLQQVLEQGGSITLTFDPGETGRCDEEGFVTDEPRAPAFEATARTWDGITIGSGSGGTVAEAMIRVYRYTAPDPSWDRAGPCRDEPPF
jgi:prevent-host-death family protein